MLADRPARTCHHPGKGFYTGMRKVLLAATSRAVWAGCQLCPSSLRGLMADSPPLREGRHSVSPCKTWPPVSVSFHGAGGSYHTPLPPSSPGHRSHGWVGHSSTLALGIRGHMSGVTETWGSGGQAATCSQKCGEGGVSSAVRFRLLRERPAPPGHPVGVKPQSAEAARDRKSLE